MSEYIDFVVSVSKDVVNSFIARFGKENVRNLFGEEIVRCRNCKYAYEVTWPVGSNIPQDYLDCTGELVELWDYRNDEPKMNPVKPDGFCAWGEPR